MKTNSFHDIFSKYFHGLQVVEERYMYVPKTIGMGEVRRWSSFSGMEIVLSNYQFHKTIAFNLHRMQQWWNLIFVYKDRGSTSWLLYK